MSTSEDANGNGRAREDIAAIKAARERVPLTHLLTVAGLVIAFVLYFENRISGLDTALQREARDLDNALNIQIQSVKETETMNSTRFVDFIYAMREWQLAHLEEAAYHRGQTDARLDALEQRE